MSSHLIRRVALAAILLPSVSFAQQMTLETDEQKYSYAIGTRIAAQLLAQFGNANAGIDMKALAAGISDTVGGGDRLLTDEEAIAAIEAQQAALQQAAAEAAEATKQKGLDWLAENKGKEGVTETESGLQYWPIASGSESAPQPGENDTVVVHYRGTLLDGTEFDSSHSRGVPATFSLNGIIPGWKEALQLMRVGDKWNIAIPSDLAYGTRGAGDRIGPNETLLFEIELLEVKGG